MTTHTTTDEVPGEAAAAMNDVLTRVLVALDDAVHALRVAHDDLAIIVDTMQET